MLVERSLARSDQVTVALERGRCFDWVAKSEVVVIGMAARHRFGLNWDDWVAVGTERNRLGRAGIDWSKAEKFDQVEEKIWASLAGCDGPAKPPGCDLEGRFVEVGWSEPVGANQLRMGYPRDTRYC